MGKGGSTSFAVSYLKEPLEKLPHYGSFFKKRLKSLVGETRLDLLRHLPSSYLHLKVLEDLQKAQTGDRVVCSVIIDEHVKTSPRSPYCIYAHDKVGNSLVLTFFHGRSGYLQKLYPIGANLQVEGKLETYKGLWQINHPTYGGRTTSQHIERSPLEPVYPLTEGVSGPALRKVILEAVKGPLSIDEWLPEGLCEKKGWPTWAQALYRVHGLEAVSDDLRQKARDRLAFDELFSHQLGMGLLKAHHKRILVPFYDFSDPMSQALKDATPFRLTKGQDVVFREILDDVTSGKRMIRLIQADVGAGKTILAFLTLALGAFNGYQGAFLAPTEILARQHGEKLKTFLEPLGFSCHLLLGGMKEKEKRLVLEKAANGQVNILVGTHALLEENVVFQRLGMVVIDEQHRFGVKQRQELIQKGEQAHVLVMTATPIPRTLLLSQFGDLDISRLLEKPGGRQPIETKVVSMEKMRLILEGFREALDSGQKAYWVCPLIEVSQESDLAAATARFEVLKEFLGDKVALLHGRMKSEEKDEIFRKFSKGHVRCLVSTTVIEVGVDVPDATLMVIEHAERFGLAQLHQLRGRVGRGTGKSTCLLLYGAFLSQEGKERLSIMRNSQDGFVIAEKDLELRGAGDLLGTRQSGLVTFRNVDPEMQGDLLPLAYEQAQSLIQKDPHLESDNGCKGRLLMDLYGTFYELPSQDGSLGTSGNPVEV